MIDQISDATLLERFVIGREEAAFAALVERHRPSVLGACRRILRNEHEAEEVSQATFLVLARKAPQMEWRDSVGGWLCAVAHRLSLHARADAARRRSREVLIAAAASRSGEPGCDFLPEEHHPLADPMVEISRRELQQVVGEEIDCLPEKYRAPVVLCYLEGMTNEEAARRLGWPVGSMSRRLERARSLLRPKLAGRGLLLALVAVCGVLVYSRLANQLDPAASRSPIAIRAAMVPFRPSEEGGRSLERLLAWVRSDDDQRPHLEGSDALAVAAQSVLVADRIEHQGPDANRPEWRRRVAELRQSALVLAQAARNRDEVLALASAQRLNTACLQCHATFRQ